MKKTVCWMMAAAAFMMIGTPDARAGSLDPAGAPAPTMHTLEEIYQKLLELQSNVAAVQQGVEANASALTELLGGFPYLVIDLSDGQSATNYPVSYLDDVPTGGWSNEYKTTKMVMRRIPAGTFTMGSPTNEVGHVGDETQHEVMLTKDFYIGVFEVTQEQWFRVMGTYPSYFTNVTYRESRPVEQVSYNTIRGSTAGAGWPPISAVDADSFMGKLRARTGQAFDLPTESQWEYAGRAGTATALNSGNNLTNTSAADTSMDVVGRYRYNHPGGYSSSSSVDTNGGTATVGSYQPNAWGLYDIHGNVFEWCLDWYGTYPVGLAVDPVGVTSSPSGRVLRGGSFFSKADICRAANRDFNHPGNKVFVTGFRVALPHGL